MIRRALLLALLLPGTALAQGDDSHMARAIGGLDQPWPGLTLEHARRLDAQAVLPAGAQPRERYIRIYASAHLRSLQELPFTTVREGLTLPAGDVILGVMVEPAVYGIRGPAEVRVETLPYVARGGCRAVNVILDADSGRTLASWCNAD